MTADGAGDNDAGGDGTRRSWSTLKEGGNRSLRGKLLDVVWADIIELGKWKTKRSQ